MYLEFSATCSLVIAKEGGGRGEFDQDQKRKKKITLSPSTENFKGPYSNYLRKICTAARTALLNPYALLMKPKG